MSSENIKRCTIANIPILNNVAEKLAIRQILAKHISTHANETVPAIDSLMILLYNITHGRRPLYELEEWIIQFDSRLFGFDHFSEGIFNDDRFGRALDKLHKADRATLMTEIVIHTVKSVDLDLDRIHNDSTSVKAFGEYPGTTNTGFNLARGKSKDHRPDLKQLVFSLTISADGAVPIHYKSYPGNRTDDTTHIETWNTVRQITGNSDFLYVADCKVCTDNQLSHITGRGGRVVTVMPDNWKEAKTFKETLRTKNKAKKHIWRRKIQGNTGEDDSAYENYSCFVGKYSTYERDYTIHWIYSGEKKKRDRSARIIKLEKIERDFTELMGKLNTRDLKTEEEIKSKVDAILKAHGAKNFYHIDISKLEEKYRVQIGKGRPGPNTKYTVETNTIFTVSWIRNKTFIRQEMNFDGIFPILCTDKSMSAKDALKAYKYQPRLEKRFTQFKSVHNAAPLLFKKVERVEAIMFLFFLSLLLQSVIEREIRLKMKDKKIDNLPIYPEHRLSYHPTTAIVFDRFENISKYRLLKGKKIVKEFKDELTKTNKKVLKLLNMTESEYWSD